VTARTGAGAVPGETAPVIPAAGSYKPGVVSVRLVCPPEVMTAALASLSDLYGDAWQASTRKPSRNADGQVLQYGTLIVPVPRMGGTA
jgi:hypothetical protein